MKTIPYNIKQYLSTLGFSRREISVYVAILELGKGTVSDISRTAEINRTTGYDILSNLVSYGLVRISGKEPKQEYVAESPAKLVSFLKKRKEEIKKQLDKTEDLLPELLSMHTVDNRPKVQFFEGTEGLKEVYEDTLTSSETILAYANVDDMHAGLESYFPKYYRRRANAGIHIKAIIPDTEIGKERASKDKYEDRESALVPADTYHFSPEINVYDNKVMIASWREKLGIIIESEEIADAMKKIYTLAWAEAKRLNEHITPSNELL
ncbi:MAG: hypothetical protein COV60_00990 [Candidatus Magasanikbacteria bacterium CG11_big_fil_rev_8_21_14_0_20_43_7]|uniref:Transcription regulator TrmB N-terminal domain-containing protein n=1 Tax=Candidatus Magasanikbacteria bacterium CG11_big_fil_rev_8_21_14_0_20_43_7 TaxID=1974654 RepID=A0A2H0N340_9BACT|nr:MAG: hypothetical protein COV60_00990 [Candidatus Magasanikbacteria bacterium CG11_big_fil_rev_8_21_14_0_20_43_7]